MWCDGVCEVCGVCGSVWEVWLCVVCAWCVRSVLVCGRCEGSDTRGKRELHVITAQYNTHLVSERLKGRNPLKMVVMNLLGSSRITITQTPNMS